MQRIVLTIALAGVLAGCGIETASTAATGAAIKQQEIQQGQQTMDQARQKIDAATQQMQQRAEQAAGDK